MKRPVCGIDLHLPVFGAGLQRITRLYSGEYLTLETFLSLVQHPPTQLSRGF